MNMDDGLTIETAAGVVLRDVLGQHMQAFAVTIRASRPTGQDVTAAYVDGLAGAAALTIAGGHGSKEEIVNAITARLRACVNRDLTHLGHKR